MRSDPRSFVRANPLPQVDRGETAARNSRFIASAMMFPDPLRRIDEMASAR